MFKYLGIFTYETYDEYHRFAKLDFYKERMQLHHPHELFFML